jgi:hypothetical protein
MGDCIAQKLIAYKLYFVAVFESSILPVNFAKAR